MKEMETGCAGRGRPRGNYLSDLNEAQRQAVTFGQGPLIVVAGAGTGKTKTLACRVAHLLSQGIRPERILLLTFTRRAAEEMLRRASLAASGDETSARAVWGGTFHATANRLLRIYSESVGLSPDFTIMDQEDAADFLDVIREELSLDKTEARFPRKSTCLAIYSRRVNGNEGLEAVLTRHFPWCLRWKEELGSLFRKYVERKQEQNVLDYDDLLLYWYYLLEDEALAADIGSRFDTILVDEYQDTNPLQAGILERMRAQNRNIMVVGDDAQSIYSFRSATVRNMLDFPSRFPGAKVIILERNYRSTEPILHTTNLLIAQARERYVKNLHAERRGTELPELVTCRDETSQDDAVIERVLARYEEGVPLGKQAVLFRASSHSASLELALSRKNIPFIKFGGLRFLEAAHIKDLVSYLRILENQRDERAWFRILQLIKGVGPAKSAEIVKHLRANGDSLVSVGTFPSEGQLGGELRRLAGLFTDLGRSCSGPAAEIERIGDYYMPLLTANYENPEERANDIRHLAGLASGHSSRRDFLSELVLDPPAFTADLAGPPVLEEDRLVLSTIHSAKGCEWDAVYLIHAADGCLPSDLSTGRAEEIEEELRLIYVAMTRARDHLHVLWPKRFYSRPSGVSDNHVYAQLSRFFTKDVLAALRETSSGVPDRPVDQAAGAGRARQIQDKLKNLWD